jgi:hypothetical protein
MKKYNDVSMALITDVFTVRLMILTFSLALYGDSDDCCSTNGVSDLLHRGYVKPVFALLSIEEFLWKRCTDLKCRYKPRLSAWTCYYVDSDSKSRADIMAL